MKIPRMPHRWNVSPRQAVAIQKQLAAQIVRRAPAAPLRYIAGIDCAFTRDGAHCIAGVVLWDAEEACAIEETLAKRPLQFPYVPGLLSFREAPAILAGLRKLRREPDALMCDGQGLAHPRRLGIACHVGLLANRPAIGCAKSRLVGSHDSPARRRGSRAELTDEGEIIGSVLRTQDGVNPVYVSIGHRMDLATAERIVLDCATKYRLPEPTRLADRLVAGARRAG